MTKTIETQTKKIAALQSGLQSSIEKSDKKIKKMDEVFNDLCLCF